MASSPSKGIKFEIEGRKIVFGLMHNGDTDALVLAIEKGKQSGDYEWWVQLTLDTIDFRVEHHNADLQEEVKKLVQKGIDQSNSALEELFGKVEDPKTTREHVEAYVLGQVEYDPKEMKLKLK